MLTDFYAALDKLQQAEIQIRADGPIAPAHIWIDPQVVGHRKYARLRSDRAQSSWRGKKLCSLGRWDGKKHQDWQKRILRRESLAEIELRQASIQMLIDRELNPGTKLWIPDNTPA